MTAPALAPLPLPVRFGADGLVPAVIQDRSTRAVLMVGFMNEAALAATRETGRVHFWSRSRRELWRKGATSGHEQIVHTLSVNCDRNSLLIEVEQIGAVCHDGYATCFYRQLGPDNQLTLTAERVFDPTAVYGASAAPTSAPTAGRDVPPAAASAVTSLSDVAAEHYAAFARLRDADHAAQSRTSALLRDPGADVSGRVADELTELAGVLDGTHAHADQRADVALEAGQVIYWVTVAALQRRVPWTELRSDLALATATSELPAALLPRMLRRDAEAWRERAQPVELAAPAHATLALVGQALALHGLDPATVLAADLAALRAKLYFAQLSGS